jgi:hypothetical protein
MLKQLTLVLVLCPFISGYFGFEKTEYRYYDYDIGGVSIYNQEVELIEERNGETYVLTYCKEKSNCFSLCLKNDENIKIQKYIDQEGVIVDLYLEEVKSFIINNKRYDVFKFVKNPFLKDGSSFYFWTPDFGIVLSKSNSWNSFFYLQSLKGKSPKDLNDLVFLIFNDRDFYFGWNDSVKIDKDIYNEISNEISNEINRMLE